MWNSDPVSFLQPLGRDRRERKQKSSRFFKKSGAKNVFDFAPEALKQHGPCLNLSRTGDKPALR